MTMSNHTKEENDGYLVSVCPHCMAKDSFMHSGLYLIFCLACHWCGSDTDVLEFTKNYKERLQ